MRTGQRFKALDAETENLKPLLNTRDVIEPKKIISISQDVELKDIAFVTAATPNQFKEVFR